MKNIAIQCSLFFFLISFISCTSIEKLVDTGQYDKAIYYATNKLSGAKVNKVEYVKGLETAFKKATDKDMAYIDKLKNEGNPETWETTWTINNQYWSHAPDKQPTLTTTMLDTVERWNVNNRSAGRVTTDLSGSQTYNVVGQSHPFHIHTNDFLIESINGLKISDDPSLNQGGDTFFSTYLDTLLLGPRYIAGTATTENPYGTPGSNGTADKPFEADLLLEFKDFPGLFVDHCHLLFHEDAGMMVAVQTILNTDSSWLVSGANPGQNKIQISMASGINEALEWNPYADGGRSGGGGINVSSGDINADPSNFQSGRNGNTVNVTDNVADVATLQKSLTSPGDRFSIHIYDGAALKKDWTKERNVSDDPLWTIDPFRKSNPPIGATTNLAIGDINGDGFADIVASLGGRGVDGVIEIFSGKNQKLIARLNPFTESKERTAINLAVGDINADGYSDIVTGQGKGGSGRVAVFSGLSLFEQLQKSKKDFLTGRSVARKAALFEEPFKPYGENYTGSVDVAASYALPRGFEANQVHQTPSANITTLAVGVAGDSANPSIRNFLYLGDNHSTDVEGHQNHENHGISGLSATIPTSVMYTSGYNTTERYVDLQAQYIDLPTGVRGEATILASTKSGRQDLLYLPETSLQSGDNMLFDSTVYRWNPTSLG